MQDETSPCGMIRVEWQFSTGLMSHEINSPRFIDARTGSPFLSLWDEQWDANVRWGGEGRFHFSLRNYGRPGDLECDVDVAAGTFRLTAPPGETRPIAEIDGAVREGFRQREREARAAQSGPSAAESGWSDATIAVIAALALLLAAAYFLFG